MFEEITKSLKATLYDRVSSPFLFSFFFAWAVWNYDFLLIFFSSMPSDEKIDYISYFLFPTIDSILQKGILFPFFSAFAYILIFPYVEQFFYFLWLRKVTALRDIRNKIETKRRLTVEESIEITVRMAEIEEESKKEIGRLASENSTLKKALSECKKKTYELQHTKENATDVDSKKEIDEKADVIVNLNANASMNANMISLIKVLAKRGKVNISDLHDYIDDSNVRIRYVIDLLEEKGLVEYFSSGDVALTKLGREVVVNNNIG